MTIEANDTARLFWEQKVRSVIDDPAVADVLIPKDHPIGAKRIRTDDNYFQTFNRDNVSLVNLRATPIERIDPSGLDTTDAHYELDALVLATGFDAMTGSVQKLNVVGRDGRTLNEAWADGPATCLRPRCPGLSEPVQHHRPRRPSRCWPTWCCIRSCT